MIYARYAHPENGLNIDHENIEKAGLIVGQSYAVEEISMGQSSTAIFLVGYPKSFNSVNFEFEEDGIEIDIFRDPRFNPYIRKRKY